MDSEYSKEENCTSTATNANPKQFSPEKLTNASQESFTRNLIMKNKTRCNYE